MGRRLVRSRRHVIVDPISMGRHAHRCCRRFPLLLEPVQDRALSHAVLGGDGIQRLAASPGLCQDGGPDQVVLRAEPEGPPVSPHLQQQQGFGLSTSLPLIISALERLGYSCECHATQAAPRKVPASAHRASTHHTAALIIAVRMLQAVWRLSGARATRVRLNSADIWAGGRLSSGGLCRVMSELCCDCCVLPCAPCVRWQGAGGRFVVSAFRHVVARAARQVDNAACS